MLTLNCMNYSANDNLEIMKYAKNYNNFLIKNVIKVLKENNYNTVLDFGCADGFFMEIIKNKVQNIEISGVEPDDTSFETCKNKNLNIYKEANNIATDFDLIYSFNVLEHIENDIQALKELFELLKNNGKLILYVPAFMFLFSSMDVKTGHYRRYSKNELVSKLNQSGFEVEKIKYCDSLGVFATLLYKLKDKLLKNNNGDISKGSIVAYDKLFKLINFLDGFLFKFFLGKNIFVIAHKNVNR